MLKVISNAVGSGVQPTKECCVIIWIHVEQTRWNQRLRIHRKGGDLPWRSSVRFEEALRQVMADLIEVVSEKFGA